MGHQISAIVCKPSATIDQVADLDLTVLVAGEFVIIPLDAYHSDEWCEKLNLQDTGYRSNVLLDGPLAHHVASIAAHGRYALIETDYFGGAGDQAAAVYTTEDSTPLYASERVKRGAINRALKLIGVKRKLFSSSDEFTLLRLDQYRHFDMYFERYHEP